jgi:hypothetical protein
MFLHGGIFGVSASIVGGVRQASAHMHGDAAKSAVGCARRRKVGRAAKERGKVARVAGAPTVT